MYRVRYESIVNDKKLKRTPCRKVDLSPVLILVFNKIVSEPDHLRQNVLRQFFKLKLSLRLCRQAENAPELNTLDSILKSVEQCSTDLDLTKVGTLWIPRLFFSTVINRISFTHACGLMKQVAWNIGGAFMFTAKSTGSRLTCNTLSPRRKHYKFSLMYGTFLRGTNIGHRYLLRYHLSRISLKILVPI